jgi:hypothetical protein
MGEHRIALQLLDRTPRGLRARADFIAALDNAKATDPDEGGSFEVCFDCAGQDDALDCVWNAMAASGADDHLVILEHPPIARHWEHRPAGGEAAAG